MNQVMQVGFLVLFMNSNIPHKFNFENIKDLSGKVNEIVTFYCVCYHSYFKY